MNGETRGKRSSTVNAAAHLRTILADVTLVHTLGKAKDETVNWRMRRILGNHETIWCFTVALAMVTTVIP